MPNAIAVDSVEKAFYWGDARMDKIERVDAVTLERRVLARDELYKNRSSRKTDSQLANRISRRPIC